MIGEQNAGAIRDEPSLVALGADGDVVWRPGEPLDRLDEAVEFRVEGKVGLWDAELVAKVRRLCNRDDVAPEEVRDLIGRVVVRGWAWGTSSDRRVHVWSAYVAGSLYMMRVWWDGVPRRAVTEEPKLGEAALREAALPGRPRLVRVSGVEATVQILPDTVRLMVHRHVRPVSDSPSRRALYALYLNQLPKR